MAEAKNQAVKSSRERLQERMREHYPDRQFGAQNEQGEQDVDADAQSVLDYLDELDGSNKKYKENSERLTNLFLENDMAAQFVNDWATTGNPVAGLVGIFGMEAVQKAVGSQEGRDALAKQIQEHADKLASEKKRSDEMNENFLASFEKLGTFATEKGLSDEQRDEIIGTLFNLGDKYYLGKYDESDFNMVLSAMNHDKDVDTAREEGIVEGKNRKMDEQRQRNRTTPGLPPSIGGQPGTMTDNTSRRRRGVFADAEMAQ